MKLYKKFGDEILFWETWEINDHYTLLIEFTVEGIGTPEEERLHYA